MRSLPGLQSFAVWVALCALFIPAHSVLGRERDETFAIVGATAYPTPSADLIKNSVVLIVNGKIESIGTRRKVRVPSGARVLDASGLTLVAGFWNCHVHFTGPQWRDAAHLPAAKLASELQRMLTRYGFTTVFDLASVLANTTAVRKRIESGEVAGPRIFTTGEPVFPKDGVPIYVKTVISAELYEELKRSAEVERPDQAAEFVDRRISNGADAIKIFAGSWLGGEKTIDMPLDLVKAVTAETHRKGRLVFAHPQTRGGLENALEGGMDILAHTAPAAGPWDDALLAKMKLKGIALIPTLKLWHVEAQREGASPERTESFIQGGVGQLRAFAGTGGRILFGTDVGYTDDYDTAEEFELMAKAGMDLSQILSALTTAPVARLGELGHQGRIAPGFDADLVLLKGDPVDDIRNLANVKYTIRAGKIIYQNPE
jgi:imidazolonepropionase-like amidohydrolase